MSTSRINLFPKLKSFATNVEKDVSKLKQQCSDKGAPSTNTSSQDINEEEFIGNIASNLQKIQSDFHELENQLFGNAANRLSYVTIDEFNEKASTLLKYNESLIALLKQRLLTPQNEHTATEENILEEETYDAENVAPADYISIKHGRSSTNRELFGEIFVPCNGENNEEDFFEVEYDLKSSRPSMSPLFNSPANSPKRVSLSDLDSKTPTLADWKLSEATKALVGRGGNPWQKEVFLDSPLIEGSSHGTPPSPTDLNLSLTTQMLTNIKLDDILDSSREGEKLTIGPHSLLISPDTPGELTPFRSYHLTAKHDIVDRSCRRSLSPDSHTSNVPSEAIFKESTALVTDVDYAERPSALSEVSEIQEKGYGIYDIASDDEQSVNISPPKIVKLLGPTSLSTADCKVSIVEPSEWTSAPAFLQKQVTVDMLNMAVSSLNEYLTSSIAVDTISQEDISSILNIYTSEASTKTVLMALVFLKRLDITTEGGMKLYKVRKYH